MTFYVSVEQHGLIPGKSSVDVLWALRWMMAITQKYKESFQISCIDLSKAFDCIDRRLLLKIFCFEVEIS